VEIFILVAIGCGVLGYMIASDDNKVMGGVLGLALGPLGVLISALLKD